MNQIVLEADVLGGDAIGFEEVKKGKHILHFDVEKESIP